MQASRMWINEHILLHQLQETKIETHDMYRFLSVMLLSHTTGLSFEKSIEVLCSGGFNAPNRDRMRFICNNIKAFSATGRGDTGMSRWSAQRDQTPALAEFESLAFRISCRCFVAPSHTIVTLDDDLYGTRASDNQVKTLSSRKADREGHTADAIADSFFRITFIVRFRRRGESQQQNVRRLLDNLLLNRGEVSVYGVLLTADRGYGKLSLARELLEHRISAMFVMPEHLLDCHPFVRKSFLSVGRHDEEEESSDDLQESTTSDDRGQAPSGLPRRRQEQGLDLSTGARAVDEVHDGSALAEQNGNSDRVGREYPAIVSTLNVPADRPSGFVIDDGQEMGPASFFATKLLRGDGRDSSVSSQVTAAAIRERGTNKFAKVLRFVYNVPSDISRGIHTWVAVPRTASSTKHLFTKRNEAGRIVRPPPNVQDPKAQLEEWILDHYTVLTIGQRCADWFVLRQFRVTGTSAGKVLINDVAFRQAVGLSKANEREENTQKKRLRDFTKSWFSSSRSTEAMMRGTANENSVLLLLSRKSFVHVVYECGMLAKPEAKWLACSPDGVALIDTRELGFYIGDNDEAMLQVASVEIKTSVAQSSLERALPNATASVITCEVGDEAFRCCVPESHLGQVVQQLYILEVRYIVYLVASETGTLFTLVAHCKDEIIEACKTSLCQRASEIVSWAYTEPANVPDFADNESKRELKSRLPFWKLVNDHVRLNDAFVPLKLLRTACRVSILKQKVEWMAARNIGRYCSHQLRICNESRQL